MIELKDIHKTYIKKRGASTHALRGVDLNMNQGDYVAVMGPSGSGKSTLMHIIGLLDRKFEGSYKLNGQDVKQLSNGKLSEFRGKNLGFVFQQFNLLERTSVIDNVLLPTIYNPKKDDVSRAFKLIEQVGLKDRSHHKGNELSGGQIQRVAIARALIMEPTLLLADEPTGTLDTKTSQGIMEIFSDINQSGTTILIITHEKEIADYANRIVYFRDGQIVHK